jgi:hypothetical protein
MNERHAGASRALAYLAISAALVAVAVTAGLSACGGSDKASANATPSAASPSPSPISVVGSTTAEGVRLPTDAVIAALEGRIAAWNRGDAEAAAAFYAEDGILEETDVSPHVITRGRTWLADRLNGLYDMGLRLAPAGAPIASGRYVAEPTRIYNSSAPGSGAAMLVFEIDAQDKLARQWMIVWTGGPVKAPGLVRSPSVRRPNLPPPEIEKILAAHMAAVNGDGQSAAALYAQRGVLEETSQHPGLETKGRENVVARLGELHDAGLRLAPAGASIAYDKYVAEPVAFVDGDWNETGAGMLVFAFDPASKIAHEWVIGWAEAP